jgi:hypothetical protein
VLRLSADDGTVNRGQFDRLVTFKQATTTTNDDGEEIASGSTTLAEAWARVRFGTGQEKRQAAQESGVQSATFEVIPTPALMAVPLTATIEYDGSDWDLTEKADLERNLMRFTATRSV